MAFVQHPRDVLAVFASAAMACVVQNLFEDVESPSLNRETRLEIAASFTSSMGAPSFSELLV
jgi:hypothetical protein